MPRKQADIVVEDLFFSEGLRDKVRTGREGKSQDAEGPYAWAGGRLAFYFPCPGPNPTAPTENGILILK